MAGPTLVGSPVIGTGVGSVSLTYPTVLAGDIAIFITEGQNSLGGTCLNPVPSGYTLLSQARSLSAETSTTISGKVMAGTEGGTVIASGSTGVSGGQGTAGTLLIVRGCPSTGFLNNNKSTGTGTQDTGPIAAFSTTVANCLIIQGWSYLGTGSTTSTPGGYVQQSKQTTAAGIGTTYSETQVASGSVSGLSQTTTSTEYSGAAIALLQSTTSQLPTAVQTASGVWDQQPSIEIQSQHIRVGGPLLGGLPSGPVTPPTLRSLYMGGSEDVFSHQIPPTRGEIYWGRANSPVTPRTLRSTMICPAEDHISYQTPAAVAMRYGGLSNKAVTPRTLRSVIVAQTDDVLSNEVPGYAEIEGGLGHKGAIPKTLRPVIIAQTEDTLSTQLPPKGDILPTRTKTLARRPTPIIQASTEDNLSYQIPPAQLYTITTNPRLLLPKTGPRLLIAGSNEDNLSYQIPPAVGTIYGGDPIGPITPPTLRPITVIIAEDILSREIPASQLLGADPNKPVTPPSLRQPIREPIIIGIEELLTGRQPESYLFGGDPNKPVTPPVPGIPLLTEPRQSISPEDFFSYQRPAEAYLYGGRAFAAVQPASLRLALIVPTEDGLSFQRNPEGTVISASRIGKIGLPPNPPDIYYIDDTLSIQRHPEATLLGGRPNKSVTPPVPTTPTIISEDVLSQSGHYQNRAYGGEALNLSGLNRLAITPPTLRQPLIVPINVLSEDSQLLQRPAEARVIGAIPLSPVRGVVVPLIIRVDEYILLDPAPSALVISKRDPKAVTPRSPNFRLHIRLAEDIISYQEPQARATLLGGKPSKAVTPPGGPRLITFGGTEDSISGEPLRITVIQGATFTKIGMPPPTPITDIFAPVIVNIKGSG